MIDPVALHDETDQGIAYQLSERTLGDVHDISPSTHRVPYPRTALQQCELIHIQQKMFPYRLARQIELERQRGAAKAESKLSQQIGRATPMAGNTHKGWAKDADPRYKGGSTISTEANLNPHFVKKSPTQEEPRAQQPDTSKPAAEE